MITLLTPVVVLAPLTMLVLVFVDQVTTLVAALRASSLTLRQHAAACSSSGSR